MIVQMIPGNVVAVVLAMDFGCAQGDTHAHGCDSSGVCSFS